MALPSPGSVSSEYRHYGLFDVTDADAPTTAPADDQLKLSREIQVVKQYLERSDDVNTAVGCLETLVRVTAVIDARSDSLSLTHLLETIAVALDVLCNHGEPIDSSTRLRILEFVNKLLPLSVTEAPPDFDFVVLLKRIQAAISFSVHYSDQNDTFSGLVFDMGSILLSHTKYNVRTSRSC